MYVTLDACHSDGGKRQNVGRANETNKKKNLETAVYSVSILEKNFTQLNVNL